MTVGTHTYELRLAAGGAGRLSRDGMADDIKWAWENEQVFLDLRGDMAADLAILSGSPPATQSRAVYLGLVPRCRSGRAMELDLRFEEPEPHFVRNQ